MRGVNELRFAWSRPGIKSLLGKQADSCKEKKGVRERESNKTCSDFPFLFFWNLSYIFLRRVFVSQYDHHHHDNNDMERSCL